jgi:putative ABC transport system permease protein
MHTLREWIVRLWGAFRHRRGDDDRTEELRLHLELAADDERRRASSPDEAAARTAFLTYGAVAQAFESLRDQRGLPWLDRLHQDIRYSVRTLLRSPGFSLPAVATLALGIGLAVAMFAVFDAVLRQPLPVADQNRLVVLWGEQPGSIRKMPLIGEHYERFREEAQTLAAVTGTLSARAGPHAALDRDDAFSLGLAPVAGNFFDVLGTRPVAGRLLRPDDDGKGAAPVMVISERLWGTRFARDPAAIGRRVALHESDLTYTIVGVAPIGLEYPAGSDAWVTFAPLFEAPIEVVPLGRLKPGATPALAAGDLRASFAQEPPGRRELAAGARPIADLVVGDVRPALVVLSAAAALLLLIACLNVANLLLVRASSRSHELGVRRALGAGRGRLVRQLLTESVVLALAAGALGALLAHGLLGVLVALAPPELPRLDVVAVARAPFGVAAAITGLAVMVFGVFPAIWATGRESIVIRTGGSPGTPPASRRGAQHALVVFQVALAIVVLTAGGLLTRTWQELERLDVGFTPDRAAMVQLAWPRERFDSGDKVAALYQRLVPRLEALPDIVAAAPVNMAPFSGALAGWDGWFVPEGRPDLERAPPVLNMAVVGAGFFEALGVPVLQGRAFADADREGAVRVVVISERAARTLWPSAAPLGRRLSLGPPSGPEDWWTVVGIVPETRYRAFREPTPTVYLPTDQFPDVLPMITTIAVGTVGDPRATLPAIRHVVAEVDRDVIVTSAAPLRELMDRQLAQPRLSAILLGLFSFGALVLASIGLYAVLAYVVRQRMRELAIRNALGAPPARLRAMVFGQAAGLAGVGIVFGLTAALAGGRFLQSVLYGVPAADPVTLTGVALLLIAVALLAAALPARRAARVDTMILIREG